MSSNKVERACSVLQKNISEIILKELNDPRLSGNLITISHVTVSKDLGYAKVFVSVLEDKNIENIVRVLNKAKGYIRKLLSGKVEFRVLPMLTFIPDHSGQYSQKINTLLKEVMPKEKEDNKKPSKGEK